MTMRATVLRGVAISTLAFGAGWAGPAPAHAFQVCTRCITNNLICIVTGAATDECWASCGEEFYALGCGPEGSCNGDGQELVCVDWAQ
jgi:hypothetical protein